MTDRTLEAIVVPYEVERGDTAMARGAVELLERGLLRGVEARGGKVLRQEVWSRVDPARGRAAVVAELARSVARAVAGARGRGRLPLVVSGGCLAALGVAAGLARAGRDLGVVWVDAHGDFNTPESSPSGYWDGMALAAVCGRSLPELWTAIELQPLPTSRVVHLGGRAFDPPEAVEIERVRLATFGPSEVGSAACRAELDRIASAADLYLHLDLDGLDPREVPAVGYPVPQGIAVADLAAALAGRKLAAITLSAAAFDRVDPAAAERSLASVEALLLALEI